MDACAPTDACRDYLLDAVCAERDNLAQMSEYSESSPFDLSKFDPSTIDLSFLRPEEQNRIRAHQYDSRELSLLLQRKNPWTRAGPPAPSPSPTPRATTPVESLSERPTKSGVRPKPQLPQPPNAI